MRQIAPRKNRPDERRLAHAPKTLCPIVSYDRAETYIRPMTETTWHTPDPHTQPEFYDDVPIKRLVAWGIDTAIVLVLCVIALPFTAFTGLFFLPALFLTISFFYRLATITQGSATLGMRIMSIEFITLDGAHFDSTTAFWHTLGFTFCCMVPPLLAVSCVMMLTTARGQGMSDVVLRTVAVNRRAAM